MLIYPINAPAIYLLAFKQAEIEQCGSSSGVDDREDPFPVAILEEC